MSHQTPLHPDADLAVVLDDLRQNIAAWGDEGLVTRFFRASICLMLLSILDTLIELLADFRAGRLPPVLPAYDELEDERTAPPSCAPAHPAALPSQGGATRPRGPAERHVRAPHPDTFADAPALPEPSAASASRRRAFAVPPAPPRIRRIEHAPRGMAGYPSAVPRPGFAKIGGTGALISLVQFVTI